MAALRLLNKKCGRMRAVSAVRRASESAGVSVRRRTPSLYINISKKLLNCQKCCQK